MSMRSIAMLVLGALGLGGLGSGCGSSRAAGTCPDKPIVEMCSMDFEYVCETREDGCEQCSCVPAHSDDHGGPLGEP